MPDIKITDLLQLGTLPPDQLRKQIAALGITAATGDNPVQSYWRSAMVALELELFKLAEVAAEANKIRDGTQVLFNEAGFEKFKENVAKISWTDSDMTLSPSKFISKFFANVLTPKSFGHKVNNFRDIYEKITPVAQCAAVEKNFIPVIDWNVCYICGKQILDGYNPISANNPTHTTRQCEHVLPAFTALGYNGLIQSAKLDVTDEQIEEFYRHEYASSHECCNQNKGDDLWITFSHGKGKYDINDSALLKTLQTISSSTSYDCLQISTRLLNVSVRAGEIKKIFLEPLLLLINSQHKEWAELFPLVIRIRQITALRLTLPQVASNIQTGRFDEIVKTKQLTLAQARLYVKFQFGVPMTYFGIIFDEMFKTIIDESKYRTSTIPNGFVERIFTIQLNVYSKRGNVRNTSVEKTKQLVFEHFKDRIMSAIETATTHICTPLFPPDGSGQIDESQLIPACNSYKGTLNLQLKNMIYAEMIDPGLISYVQTEPQTGPAIEAAFRQKLSEYVGIKNAMINAEIHDANQEVAAVQRAAGAAPTIMIGGSKKKKSSKIYMTGGEADQADEIRMEVIDAIFKAGVPMELVEAIDSRLPNDMATVAERVHARTNRVLSTQVNMIPNTSGLPGPFERGYSFFSQGKTKTVAERRDGNGNPVMQNVSSNEIYPVDMQYRLFLADQKRYRFGGSNMNRKTRKNRFSLLGKRTPSARIPKTRTKTQSAKPKQRKNRTLRKKQK